MDLLQNILKPSIPFEGFLSFGNLTPGHTILIKGESSTAEPCGFSLNLTLGSGFADKRSDTALHFNPRFSEKCVVRSSYQKKTWGTEERGNGMPFKIDTPFLIQIITDLYSYKISVDGQFFCDFKHRLPLTAVNTVTIEGKVDISCIQIYGPKTLCDASAIQSGCNVQHQPIDGPVVPLTTEIPNGLHHGKMIFISGTPPGTSRFSIYLQEGTSHNAEVGLVFDVRFNFGSCVDTIIRNHRSRGQWGQEERAIPYFPFKRNTDFEMLILTEQSQFKIAVNNQHFINFKHRLMPIARFNMLLIDGDVTLHQVRFQ